MPRPFGTPSALVLAAAAILPLVPLRAARQDGLVVYLTFDDKVAPLRNLAADSEVQPEQKGEALEMSFVEGRFERAAMFTNNPSSGRINDWAINLGKLDAVYAGDFSIACWVKYGSSHSGVIIGNKEYSNAFSPGYLCLATAAKHFHAAGAAGSLVDGRGADMADNRWHHWAGVFDRTAGVITFYQDGKAVVTQKLSDSASKLDNGANTFVGAGADGKNAAKIAVDDLGVWNRALTQAEVEALGTAPGLTDGAPKGRRIPEPSTYALAGGAAGLTAAWVARRRRSSR